MDYKEKYEQALRVAKETYDKQPMYREWLEQMFPELKESEDEKVRKELIDAIRGLWDNDALPMPLSAKRKKEWIAWLENIPVTIDHEKREGFHLGYRACHEKQGNPVLSNSSNIGKDEQKPAWSEEDEENMKKILEAIGSYYYLTTDDDVLCNWLKSLKGRVQPRQEWSEEDDITRKALINLVEMFYGGCIDNRLLSWLKSLRPQNRWKPSERQLACLQDAIEHYHLMGSPATTLTEILKQLRKLKEGKV